MILDAIVCIILIASILGQEAKSAGMGGMGGGADTVFSSKARGMALYICIYVQLAAALAAILIFKQTLVGQVLCALTCVQSLVYTGCYWYYNRKY